MKDLEKKTLEEKLEEERKAKADIESVSCLPSLHFSTLLMESFTI